jgi:hypothetical protein
VKRPPTHQQTDTRNRNLQKRLGKICSPLRGSRKFLEQKAKGGATVVLYI